MNAGDDMNDLLLLAEVIEENKIEIEQLHDINNSYARENSLLKEKLKELLHQNNEFITYIGELESVILQLDTQLRNEREYREEMEGLMKERGPSPIIECKKCIQLKRSQNLIEAEREKVTKLISDQSEQLEASAKEIEMLRSKAAMTTAENELETRPVRITPPRRKQPIIRHQSENILPKPSSLKSFLGETDHKNTTEGSVDNSSKISAENRDRESIATQSPATTILFSRPRGIDKAANSHIMRLLSESMNGSTSHPPQPPIRILGRGTIVPLSSQDI